MKFSNDDLKNALAKFKEAEIETLALILQSLYKGNSNTNWDLFNKDTDINSVKTLAIGFDIIVELPNGLFIGELGKEIMNPEIIGVKAQNVGKIINSIISNFITPYSIMSCGIPPYFKENYGMRNSAYYRKA